MLCVFLNPEFELNGLSGFLRELTIAYNYVLEAMCRWSVDVNEMGVKHTCRFLLGQR